MAIEIKFLANLVSFLRGTRDMGDHLDQVGDSIADVVQEADRAERATGDIGDGIVKGAREADTALDRLRRGFDDVRDTSRRTSKGAGDDFDRMGQNTQEFKNEATQNFSEFASSFNGDVTQMADGVQGLTGGLASALTPGIGIPVAVLGAASAAFLQNWIDATEEQKERISGMFQHMLDTGSSAVQETFIREEMTRIADDADRWAQAQERAASSGVEVSTVLRAMAGDTDAIAVVREGERQKLEENLALIRSSADSEQIKADKIDAANLKYQVATEWLGTIISDTDTAASKAAQVAAGFESSNTSAQRVRDTVAGIIRDLDQVGKGTTIKIDADTTGIDGALRGLQGRTISVNVDGHITRIGNQVW